MKTPLPNEDAQAIRYELESLMIRHDYQRRDGTWYLFNRELLRIFDFQPGSYRKTAYFKWHTQEELERLLPEALTAKHLMQRVRLYHISIPDREHDGIAYVEYSFGCACDEEHGVLLVLHRAREKFCGFKDSGW